MNSEFEHKPVLLDEVMTYLAVQPEGVYIDGTFGRGGHARAILQQLGQKGRLIAFDQDITAITYGKEKFHDERLLLQHSSFTKLEALANSLGIQGKVNGILLDLGVSSPQLDDSERGFSFLRDGPLDMRMDSRMKTNAQQWLNTAPWQEIAKVLHQYGEERFAKPIAKAIIVAREENPITTTGQLAALIKAANPSKEKNKHPATRSFQAIRIFINQELAAIETVLDQCLEVLAIGGRLVIISFHSLEDRIVKRFIQKQAKGDDYPRDFPVQHDMIKPKIKMITRGVRATPSEIEQNPRARSAILRVAEKLT